MVPIAFIPVPGLEFELPKACIVGLLGITGWFLFRKTKVLPRKLGVLEWSGSVFALTVIVSPLWSIAPLLSLVGGPPRYLGILSWLALFSIFFAAASFEKKQVLLVMRAMVIATAVVVLYGLLQLLRLDPLTLFFQEEGFLGRVFSTLGAPNALGVFLLLTLPYSLMSFFDARGRKKRFLGALLFATVVVILATGSRSTLLGLIVFCMMLLPRAAASFATLKRHERGRVLLGGALALILFLALGIQTYGARFAFPWEPGRSTAARQIIWSGSFDIINAHPLGIGPETMGLLSELYMEEDLWQYELPGSIVDRAHSLPLDLWLAFGPLGLLSFSLSVGLILVLSLLQKDRTMHFLSSGSFGFLVASSVSFPTVALWTVFALNLGLLYGFCRKRERELHYLQHWLLCVGSVLLCVLCVFSILGKLHALQAAYELHRGKLPEATAEYLRAATLAPFDREVLVQAIEVHVLLMENVSQAERSELRHNLETLLEALEHLTAGKDSAVERLKARLQQIDS